MKMKPLVIIDNLFAGLFKAAAIMISRKNLILKAVTRPRGKVVVVKFVGAGNFIPLARLHSEKNLIFVTLKSNEKTIIEFIPEARVISIEDRSYPALFISMLTVCVRLVFMRCQRVVNLEPESSFAKFICSLPLAYEVFAITNRHRSIFDTIFYDFFVVSSSNFGRAEAARCLINDPCTLFSKDPDLATLWLKHNEAAKAIQKSNKESLSVIIAPSCSPTDEVRRLKYKTWSYVLDQLDNLSLSYDVIFASVEDSQFDLFSDLLTKRMKPAPVVCSYDVFLKKVRSAKFLITVDSQALHVGQHFGVPTLCFFGPTNPNGIDLSSKTRVITNALRCSPCTHLYFSPPCDGRYFCQDYSEIEVAKQLNELAKV